MDKSKHKLWAEKYAPRNLDEYVFHDSSHEAAFRAMVKDGSIPHLLLSGVQGSGKTTMAVILTEALGIDPVDLLVVNASDENSVDDMRSKIKSFISTFAIGDFKVVHLEEADYLSHNAQGALRFMMGDEYSDTVRFILTCNYTNKILPAIRSRCQEFAFSKHDVVEVTELTANILIKEKVKFDLGLLDKYIRTGYPDIRKIVNLIQQNSHTGTLLPMSSEDSSGDYKFELLNMIERDDWNGARQLVCSNVTPEEWPDVYRFLYENLNKAPKFSEPDAYERGIVAVAEYLYKHSIVADPEINAAALFITLGRS